MSGMSLAYRLTIVFSAIVLSSVAAATHVNANQPAGAPMVGETAKDFTLATVDGESAELKALLKQGPVVLIVLRGFPGYQCPVCNAQVGQFITGAKKIKAAKGNVVLVYPGPADGLKQRAEEFIRGKTLPDNFYLTLDPDFVFTNAYHLRWEAKNETAYPSTFVIAPSGKIRFARISMTHGGRASVDEVLKALEAQ